MLLNAEITIWRGNDFQAKRPNNMNIVVTIFKWNCKITQFFLQLPYRITIDILFQTPMMDSFLIVRNHLL